MAQTRGLGPAEEGCQQADDIVIRVTLVICEQADDDDDAHMKIPRFDVIS